MRTVGTLPYIYAKLGKLCCCSRDPIFLTPDFRAHLYSLHYTTTSFFYYSETNSNSPAEAVAIKSLLTMQNTNLELLVWIQYMNELGERSN
jgi:hypothetical protein